MSNTKLRQVAEKYKISAVLANYYANQYVVSGLCASVDEALDYMLEAV